MKRHYPGQRVFGDDAGPDERVDVYRRASEFLGRDNDHVNVDDVTQVEPGPVGGFNASFLSRELFKARRLGGAVSDGLS